MHFLDNFRRFSPIQAVFVVGEPLCDLCRNPILGPNKSTEEHLMKIKWFLVDVIAVGSPGLAERTILGIILAGRCFGQFRPYLWSGSPNKSTEGHLWK